MDEPYLITKNGYYYRPNAQGYCSLISEAGVYSKDEALERSRDREHVKAIPVSRLQSEILDEVDRLEQQVKTLKGHCAFLAQIDSSEDEHASALVMPDTDRLIDVIHQVPAEDRTDAYWLFNGETMSHLFKMRDADGVYVMRESGDKPSLLFGYPWWVDSTMADGEITLTNKGRDVQS